MKYPAYVFGRWILGEFESVVPCGIGKTILEICESDSNGGLSLTIRKMPSSEMFKMWINNSDREKISSIIRSHKWIGHEKVQKRIAKGLKP